MLHLASPLLRTLRRSCRKSMSERLKSSRATTTTKKVGSLEERQYESGTQTPGSFQEHEQKLPARDPLVKNFFVGEVDKELLAYPEVITREEMTNLQNDILPLKNFLAVTKVPLDSNSLASFRRLGFYGLNVPKDYEGLGYAWSSSLMASEPDAAYTSVGLGLQAHRVIVDLLREAGTPEQQDRYFSRMASGELIATEAIFEYTPPEDEFFNTRAVFNAESSSWTLSGEKAFVVCAPAELRSPQLFAVLAQSQHANMQGNQGRGLTLFIVESDQPGVRLGEQHQTFGCHNTTMQRVYFDNVDLTEQCIVGLAHDGNRLAELLVRASRLRSSLLGISLGKRLLNEQAQYTLETTQCGVEIKDLEFTRVKLSKAMSTIYAMESMLYFTAGLLDEFKDQDVTLECAIIKYYTLKKLYAIASQSLDIFGPKCLHTGQPAELGLRDAAQLYTQGEPVGTLGMFIALTGLYHAGQFMKSGVRKSRNPLFHPGHIFGKFFEMSSIDNPKTKMHLAENVHPTLESAAQCIEHSVARLQIAVEFMLTRHGNAVVERQNDLQRVADMVTTIYAMFASVARASRSYCIGLPLADHELLTASAVCSDGRDYVKILCMEICSGNYVNNDNNLLRLSKQIMKSRGYFFVHPLTFNF